METTSSLDAVAIVARSGKLCLLAAQTQQTIYEEDGETIWETAIDGVSLYALDLAGDTATAGAEVCALDWEDLILGGADDAWRGQLTIAPSTALPVNMRASEDSYSAFYTDAVNNYNNSILYTQITEHALHYMQVEPPDFSR